MSWSIVSCWPRELQSSRTTCWSRARRGFCGNSRGRGRCGLGAVKGLTLKIYGCFSDKMRIHMDSYGLMINNICFIKVDGIWWNGIPWNRQFSEKAILESSLRLLEQKWARLDEKEFTLQVNLLNFTTLGCLDQNVRFLNDNNGDGSKFRHFTSIGFDCTTHYSRLKARG